MPWPTIVRRPSAPIEFEPFDRRLAVAPEYLVELVDALCGVELERQVVVAGVVVGVADQLRRAGVDLGRTDHAAEPAGGVLVGECNELACLVETLAARGEIPVVGELVAIAREPPRIAEHRRDHGAHPRFRQRIQPAVEGKRQIDHGRDAAHEEFGECHFGCRLLAREIVAEDGQVFIERAVPEAGTAGLVGDALAQRLAARVRVNIDEAGQDQALGAIDLDVGGAGIAVTEKDDSAVPDREVDIAAVDVARVRCIPRDEPVGVAEYGRCRHGGRLLRS